MKKIVIEVDKEFYDAFENLVSRANVGDYVDLFHEAMKVYSLFVCLTDRKGYEATGELMRDTINLYSFIHRMHEMGASIVVSYGGISRDISEIFSFIKEDKEDLENVVGIPRSELERIAKTKTSEGKLAEIIDLFKD